MTGLSVAEALDEACRLQAQGRSDKARTIYFAVLKVTPNCPEALVGLGLALERLGQAEAARDLLAKAARRDPIVAANVLLRLRSAMGDAAGREAALLDCLLADSGHPSARSNLLDLFLGRAVADSVRAAEPQRAMAYFRLSEARAGRPLPASPVSPRLARSVKEHCSLAPDAVYHLLRPAAPLPLANMVFEGVHEPFENRPASTNELYIAEVPQATVFAGSDLILVDDEDGTAVLCDNLRHPLGHLVRLHNEPRVRYHDGLVLMVDTAADEVLEFKTAIMLLGSTTRRYGHWVYEHFPKLECFAGLPGLIGTPILVDADMPESHEASLAMALNGRHPVVRLAPGQAARVERLFTAPNRTFLPHSLAADAHVTMDIGPCAPDGLDYFGRTCLQAMGLDRHGTPEVGRRIFLSRRKCTFRHCVNETDVLAALEPLGFEEVYPEEMAFTEQVRLFNSAEMIVGPNGSAFTNILFAKITCKVVMLFSPHLANWISWLCAVQNLGYRPVGVCGPEALAVQAGTLAAKHVSYHIDPDLAVRVVSDLAASRL